MTSRRRAGSGLSSVEYVCDDTREFGCWLLFLQQVAHELGVWKLQNRVKCLFIRFRRIFVSIFEVAQQQLVEFAHSSSALPL